MAFWPRGLALFLSASLTVGLVPAQAASFETLRAQAADSRAVTSGLEEELGEDDPPADWVQRVIEAVRVQAEQGGETSPAQYHALLLAAVSKEAAGHSSVVRALQDPAILRAVADPGQLAVTELRALQDQVTSLYRIPPEERILLGQALGVDFPQGIGFFRWAFDPAARALRKFPDAEQRPTLQAIQEFRRIVGRTPGYFGYDRYPYSGSRSWRVALNEELIRRINAATDARAVRTWVEAAADLGKRFMSRRELGKELPPLAQPERAQFETLVDRAVRLRREGVAFEVTPTPEWGQGETIQLVPADPSRLAEAFPAKVVEALGKFPRQQQATLAGQIEALRRQVKARPVGAGARLSANPDMIQTVSGLLADSASFAEAQARISAFRELLRRIDGAADEIKWLGWAQVSVGDLTRRIARLAAAGIPFELTLAPEWGTTETLQLSPRDPAYAAEAVPQGVLQAVGKFPSSTRQALVLAILDLQHEAGPAYTYQVPKGARGLYYSRRQRRSGIPSLVDILNPKLRISATEQEALAWIESLQVFFRALKSVDPASEGSLVAPHWEKSAVSSFADSATPEQARGRLIALTSFLEQIPAELVVTETQTGRRGAEQLQRTLTIGHAVRSPEVYGGVVNPGIVTGMGTARQALQRVEIVRTLIERMRQHHPALDWAKVYPNQFLELAEAAIRLYGQGQDYAVQVTPEKGGYETRSYEEYGDYSGGSYTRTEEVYVMDSPQTVRLNPAGTAPAIVVKSLALDEEFLRMSGVLALVAQAYRQEREPVQDPGRLRQWLSTQSVGEGAQFDLPRVGLIPRYYPLAALGEDVVVRVYETGQERTMVPVSKVLVRGEIDDRLRYEVIPKSEFEAIAAPDELLHWAVAKAAQVRPLQLTGAAPAPVETASDQVLRQLAEEFGVGRVIEASEVYSPEGQAEITEKAQRQERIDRFTAKLTEAGLPISVEHLERAAESLTNRPDLLVAPGDEARMLWATHRVAATVLASDDPEKRLALLSEAAGASTPSGLAASAQRTERLARVEEVRDRATTLGMAADELLPALQRTIWLAQVPSEQATLKQLEERNWLWRSVSAGMEELARPEVLGRIRTLKERLPAIFDALRLLQIERPLSLYALGSYVWGREPNDVDLIVITEGNRWYSILEPQHAEGFELPLHVRVVGLDTLERAVTGQQMVDNHSRIRMEAMVLFGSAALIAGHDLFAGVQPPVDNLSKLIEYYDSKVQGLATVASLTEEERRVKAAGWAREAMAMRQVLAERRIAAFAEAVSRLDEAIHPYAAPLAPAPKTQRATIIIPREALVDGTALAGVRRIVQQRPSTTLVVAGVIAPEEKAVLVQLSPRLQILETSVPVSDRDSAKEALETAKKASWWDPKGVSSVRVLVPTESSEARPEAVEGVRLLYYLAPMEDEVLVLDTLIQSAYQDLFAANFPVVQVIIARVPVAGAGMGTLVSEFRRHWALAVGA